jgi:hypothetical protein
VGYKMHGNNVACSFMWMWNLGDNIRKRITTNVAENRVERKIFGLKREEETGGWKKIA